MPWDSFREHYAKYAIQEGHVHISLGDEGSAQAVSLSQGVELPGSWGASQISKVSDSFLADSYLADGPG